MMELVSFLTCFNILNIVVATPYGYGVKSGAAAKAVSTGLAGAYEGIGAVPLSISSGGSISGSFSKSSSSSFAASSASSSTSAFTISGSSPESYSHYGLNGIPGASGGCSSGNCQTGCATRKCQTGCTAGNCQSSNNKEISNSNGVLNTGTSQSYNSAKAGTVSGAIASSIPQDNKEYSGCNGNNCNSNLKDVNCKDGQCAPNNSQDVNDIKVKNTYSDNFNGNNKANSYNNFQSSNGAYNKPSTYLTTPKESTLCTSSQCGFNNENVYDTAKPTSYNVPIHGSYVNPSSESQQPINPCSSGNCESKPTIGTSYNEKYGCTSNNCGNSPSIYPHNIKLTEQKGCTSGNCGSFPSTQQTFELSKFPTASLNTPPFKPNSCTTPNCGGSFPQPSHPSFAQQPGPILSPQSNTGASGLSHSNAVGLTTENVPYKGGFGGPPGLLKPNDFGTSASLNKVPSSAPNPTQCLFGNCDSKPQNPNFIHKPPISTGAYNPSPCFSGKCISNPVASPYPQSSSVSTGTYVHTSGFGAPAGILKPNDNAASSVLTSNYNRPIQKQPAPPCSSGTCGSPFNPSLKPPTGNVQPVSSIPYPTPVSIQTVPQYKPTAPSDINPSSCTSGNCHSNPIQLTSPYNNNIPNPTSPVATFTSCSSGNCGRFPLNSQTLPQPVTCTSGNCGTPAHQVAPLSTAIGSSASNHFPCSSGNCGNPSNYPTPTQSNIQSGSYKPTVCDSGNCATALNSQYSHHGHNGADAAAAAAASSQAVVYTGGFGGPPGLLKPYDDGKLKSETIGLAQHTTYNGVVPNTGSYSSHGKSINFDTAPVISVGKAQSLAVAGTSLGVYGGKIKTSEYTKTGNGGCSGGCETKIGGIDLGSHSGFLEGAATKSTVKTGAASYGQAGSFASSSASAYASATAGAAAKTGYGR